MEPLEVVGQAIGAIAHIRIIGAGVTLCGLGTTGYLMGRRFFMPNQSNCDDCLDKYKRKHRTVSEKKGY